MLKGSFWYPQTVPRAILLLGVLIMIPLHQSELLGLMSTSTLVFGWVPLQLAYDVTLILSGVVVLYAMYRMAPEPPEEHEPTIESDESEAKPAGGEQ
ncbi:hypothetical protein EA462_13825 [Natrarchaeobius halalkaliphilus]|uniref:Uncharacterized protein n=2 Tax=Natrarchaeobius halalkaliphilus TaxID=1679091 RepID=A0A3N6LIW6_9EURY|nr:hypothetical protein EA462_13825 [Natrarchaeobius halalkaliphilus]